MNLEEFFETNLKAMGGLDLTYEGYYEEIFSRKDDPKAVRDYICHQIKWSPNHFRKLGLVIEISFPQFLPILNRIRVFK
jgi:hypothetical protein